VFDDSPQAARIELGSSTLVSQLQLGALLQQQDNQRLAPRGHGLDLLTQGHGALRSGSGLLLTAFAESPSTGSGQQLQARDPLQALQTAQDLVHTLAETAQAHQAQLPGEPAVAGAKPDDRSHQLPSEQGLATLATSLQASDSRQGGDSTGDESTIAIDGGWGSVSAWDRPDITLAAPAGLGLFTPAQAILSTQASLTLSAGQDLLSLAQGHHASVAKAGAVLFTYGQASSTSKPNTETGIAIHAATGSLQASANTATAELTASQAIDVASTQANVLVGAPTSVLLTAAGAAIDIQSGSITLKAPGSVLFKAASKVWTGAGTAQSPSYPLLVAGSLVLPDQFSARFDLYDVFVQHRFQEVKYSAKLSDGKFLTGTLDPHGRSRQIYASDQKDMEILAGPDKPAWDLIFDYEDAGI
jgi:type VI secretion system secreted protein VgrG